MLPLASSRKKCVCARHVPSRAGVVAKRAAHLYVVACAHVSMVMSRKRGGEQARVSMALRVLTWCGALRTAPPP